MAVLAHPDDESRIIGGTLARYTEAGIHVVLVCATRGERGSVGNPPICTAEELPLLREAELCHACSLLGVKTITTLPYRDRELAEADPERVIGDIVREIRQHQPQVLITFGPEGRTLHPDHIAIHHYATQAFHISGDANAYSDHLQEDLMRYSPLKLYYTAFPQSITDVIGPHFPGVPDEEITVTLDITPWLERKRQAIAAHRTQATPPFAHLSEARRWEILSKEYYVLAASRPLHQPSREEDLFAGID